MYWELEMPRSAPSPIRHLDPDLKTTPISCGDSSGHDGEMKQKQKTEPEADEDEEDEGTLKRNSQQNHPHQCHLKTQIPSFRGGEMYNGGANENKDQSQNTNSNNNSSNRRNSGNKHTTKVQVWIPQKGHKPKVMPKPKKEHLEKGSRLSDASRNIGGCNAGYEIYGTLPRSCGHSKGISGHHPGYACSAGQGGGSKRSSHLKSQSCDHISAAAGRQRHLTNTTSSQEGAVSSSNKGYVKNRSQTPPRVLSPSIDNMSCEVIADI